LLVGYFEGLDSERGIAWRAADSLAVRTFLGLGLEDASPDHSTISRTRRLIDVDTHGAAFTWVQERLVEAKLLRGQTVGIDATTLEANAAMRIVRRSRRRLRGGRLGAADSALRREAAPRRVEGDPRRCRRDPVSGDNGRVAAVTTLALPGGATLTTDCYGLWPKEKEPLSRACG
jgi:hypothetical protein